MTPKEKAKQLYGKFYEAAAAQMFNESRGWYIDEKESASNAKSCAIITVDEIIKTCRIFYKDMCMEEISTIECYDKFIYWNQVKEEISKM